MSAHADWLITHVTHELGVSSSNRLLYLQSREHDDDCPFVVHQQTRTASSRVKMRSILDQQNPDADDVVHLRRLSVCVKSYRISETRKLCIQRIRD